MTLRHLSASALSDFRECPMLHIGRRVERWFESKPPYMAQAMALGRAVHAGLEAHHQGKDAIAALCRVWGSLGVAMPAQYFPKALGLLRVYTSQEQPDPRDQMERKFTLDIPGVSVPIIGYIDLQRGLTVREYKTTGSATWWTQERADASIQGSLYAMAVSREHHGAQVSVEFHILSHRNNAYSHTVLRTTRTKAQLEQCRDEIRETWQEMQYEPRVAKCPPGRCRFPDHCKEYGYASTDTSELILG